MTHIVGIAEGYWDYIDKMLKFFHGKEYAGGRAKVRARAMIPIHFGINECGREEFLKDLRDFSGFEGSQISDGGKTIKRLGFFANILRKLFPTIKDINKELDGIKGSGLRWKESALGNHFICAFYPVGEIEDAKVDGVEIV